MTFDEYNRYDATGLAKLIASREVTAAEVTEAAIVAIESLNPRLNAVITPMFELARGSVRAGLPEGPLSGVPYLLKDLNTWVAGAPATNGCRAFRDFVPTGDSVLVSRLRAAGLVILGKTNTPEFGLSICTSPALFGPTPNPFDSQRSAGGSSGGSACAVAAGMVPAAHATDSGGSIRIPASHCGLFGLKPSRARVPLGNDQAEGLAGFSCVHALSHSVRDSALLLELTAGPMAGDIYTAESPDKPFSECVEAPLPHLKVALWTEGYAGEPIHRECQSAARQAAQWCESLGCEVERAKPAIDGQALRHAFDVLFSANLRAVVSTIATTHGDQVVESLVEPVTFACSEAAASRTAVDYVAALQITHQAARVLGQFFEKFDILLTPTLANPPLALGALDMQTNDWSVYLDRMLDEIPFTPLFNATGAPAASVPLGKCADGLPVGVQIGAALGREDTLLRLAAALEQTAPWHQRI
jgi:Asp-tRNA(Asn)/Glu-tRNA(Gln) amidotransferase A subunit family amidase